MMHIGELEIAESWSEYAVEVEPGFTMECDDLEEALTIAKNFDAKVQERQCFLSEWFDWSG